MDMDKDGMIIYQDQHELGYDNDPQPIRNSDNQRGNKQERFEMADLMWPCDSEYPCSPNEFKEKMMTKLQVIGGEQMTEKMSLLRQYYNMTLKYFRSNHDITQRCVGLEFTEVYYYSK